MAELMDYIDWRGDLSFSAAPFCEADSLGLCKLVCHDWGGIVPRVGEKGSITLAEAAREYFASHSEDECIGAFTPPLATPFLKKAAECRRYADIKLEKFASVSDAERAIQFSALTLRLPRGVRYIIYRGTDDTLAAWRENCNMGFMMAVPAQELALEYLIGAAGSFGPLMVGGHSKGGNLAVYAAMHAPAPLQGRIRTVYDYDAPGFEDAAVSHDGYERIRNKIHSVVPETSLVGMLLGNKEECAVVKSRGRGIGQHDVFTWQVLGGGLVRAEGRDRTSEVFAETMRLWERELDLDARRRFFDALFDVFDSMGAKTLTDLTENRLRKGVQLLRSLTTLEPDTRELVTSALLMLLAASGRSMIKTRRPKEKATQPNDKNAKKELPE